MAFDPDEKHRLAWSVFDWWLVGNRFTRGWTTINALDEYMRMHPEADRKAQAKELNDTITNDPDITNHVDLIPI